MIKTNRRSHRTPWHTSSLSLYPPIFIKVSDRNGARIPSAVTCKCLKSAAWAQVHVACVCVKPKILSSRWINTVRTPVGPNTPGLRPACGSSLLSVWRASRTCRLPSRYWSYASMLSRGLFLFLLPSSFPFGRLPPSVCC